jgi:hypothetical protein
MKPAINSTRHTQLATRAVCITLTVLLFGCVPEDLTDKLTGSDSSSESSQTTKTTVPATAPTDAWEGNPAPVIEPLGAQSTPAGQRLSFNVVVSDLSMIALMEPPMFALMAPRRGTVSAFQTG